MIPIQIELIHYGNELLIGEIVNTNATWLAKRLSELGFQITRISTLDDSLKSLEEGFTEALHRKPDVIISTGGLGPTWDDSTLIGLAKAVNEPLEQNSDALRMIEQRYSDLGFKLNPARLKMAKIPRNAQPLRNSVGTAPGVIYILQNIHIIAVPGVPKEMKAMIDDQIIPLLSKTFSSETMFFQNKFIVKGLGESMLAPITSALSKEYPSIYIKSHPLEFFRQILFHITTYGNSDAEMLLKKVVNELIKSLKEISGTIHPYIEKKES
ncbi:MAG: molybdopterin-binding protein [Candidatus Hodarchaeales archaeon]|jgi:molybdenum cofactor synthesis domain-containing protein